MANKSTEKTVWNYLQFINDQPNAKLRKQAMQECWDVIPHVKKALILAFDDGVEFLLPQGYIEYRPNPLPYDQHAGFPVALRQVAKLINDNGHIDAPDLDMDRRIQLYVGLLESMDADDAQLFQAIKDKQLTKLFKNVTKKLFDSVAYQTTDETEAEE